MCKKNNIKKLTVEEINEIYFGTFSGKNKNDRKLRDYIVRDFEQAIKALILHDILCHAIEFNRDDNGIILAETNQFFDCGLLVVLRKLLKSEYDKKHKPKKEPGSCTGGDFIDDLANFSGEEIFEYNGKEENIAILDGRLLTHNDMRKMALDIRCSAANFKDKGYYGRIVKENEGLGLHKNRKPIKRRICSEENYNDDSGLLSITTYTDLFEIDIKLAVECMEDFAGILLKYKNILEFRQGFPVRFQEYTVKKYIEKALDAFGYNGPYSDKLEIINSVVERFKKSFELLRWEIS